MEFSVYKKYVIRCGESEQRLTFTIISQKNIRIFHSNIDNFNLFYSHYVFSDANCKFRYLIF